MHDREGRLSDTVAHLKDFAMTTVQIELPDAIAKAAQAAGLLTPASLNQLLSDALVKREAGDRLIEIADRVAAAGDAPMTMEEINAEVKAMRQEKRQRASGH